MLKSLLRGLVYRLLLVLARIRFRVVWLLAGRKAGVFTVSGPEQESAGSAEYLDRYFTCADGLQLYFRDYPRAGGGLTVLCLHGLTRNGADFDEIARVLHREYRVIVLDQRGRGHSDYDPVKRRYRPDIYVQDTLQLIEALELDDILLLGTSMGALMAIMLGAMKPSRFRGIVLNEAGPVIESRGLEKIKNYLKNVRPVTSWEEAEQLCRDMYGPAFPGFNDAAWKSYARKTWFDDGRGNPVAACDPEIARRTVNQSDAMLPGDLWPLFESASGVPVLVMRGELSELLSEKTVADMCRRHPDCVAVTIANVGHAPTLAEPPAERAILDFAQRVRP